MNIHSIDLTGYYARACGSSTIYLGTAGSHGNEQLQVTQGKGWEGLTVQVVFHPSKVAVQLPANGLLDVPWEATAQPLTAMQGRIVFQGFDQDRLVNSTDLAYTVASHSPAVGRDEELYTPGIVEGVLNQMAADKSAILQAAQQTGQAKEAAAASAAAAEDSAANAQQNAGAANTSAGQASASASQAAGSAAAAGETLTQVQTAGQEAQQKVKDAETEALDKIAAAAPTLPAVFSDVAWQSVTVKPDGTGYNLAALAPIEATIRPTVTGNPAVCENSVTWGLQGLKIYGKSIQNGTPSPENPVPIISAGEGGSISLNILGENLFGFGSDGENGYLSNRDGTVSSPTATNAWASNFICLDGIDLIYTKIFGYDKSQNDNYAFRIGFYGASKKWIKNYAFGTSSNTMQISVPEETKYIRISAPKYANIEVSLNEIGDYVPYHSQTLMISTPNALPGIPVDSGGTSYTDQNNRQLLCNVVDLETFVITKNVSKTVLSSSFKWLESNNGHWFYTLLSDASNALNSPLLCNYFEPSKKGWGGPPESENSICLGNISQGVLGIAKAKFGNVDTLKTWLDTHTVEVIYPLAVPETTPLSPEEITVYRALTTYAGTTVVSTAEPVQGLEVSYVMDGNKYRESLDKRLAALEAAQTSI